MKGRYSFWFALLFLCSGCSDSSLIYESKDKLLTGETVKVHSVRVIEDSIDSLRLNIDYTYNAEVPPEKVRFQVVHDHPTYWSAKLIQVQRGRHQANTIAGINRGWMEVDGVSEFKTKTLKVELDHYESRELVANIWSLVLDYPKSWRLGE